MTTQSTIDQVDQLINEKEAAGYLGFTVRALQNWRYMGGGPTFIRISARAIRYRKKDLQEWINARSFSNTSQYPDEVVS